jgi:hypothetical protein
VQRRLHVCCSYSETGIIIVLKFVARKQIVDIVSTLLFNSVVFVFVMLMNTFVCMVVTELLCRQRFLKPELPLNMSSGVPILFDSRCNYSNSSNHSKFT